MNRLSSHMFKALTLARLFAAGRRAGAAVEFALIGFAFFAYLMGILNLGLLGLTLSTMQRALELTARSTAVGVAANGTAAACPTAAAVQTAFNGFAAPVIAANSVSLTFYAYTSTGSIATQASPWVKAGSGINGGYIAVNGSYLWKPVGFSAFSGIPLTLTAVAFTSGGATCS